jgi:hypothetical protein
MAEISCSSVLLMPDTSSSKVGPDFRILREVRMVLQPSQALIRGGELSADGKYTLCLIKRVCEILEVVTDDLAKDKGDKDDCRSDEGDDPLVLSEECFQ